MTEQAARNLGGSYLAKKWDEKPGATKPEKPADAVAADMVAKLGLQFRGVAL